MYDSDVLGGSLKSLGLGFVYMIIGTCIVGFIVSGFMLLGGAFPILAAIAGGTMQNVLERFKEKA